MSQETTKSDKILYPVIPHDAIITVEFSGFFINRIQNLLIAYCNTMSKENVIKAFEETRSLQPCSTIEKETVGVLMCLVESLEGSAKEQNKVQEIELSPEDLAKVIEHITIRPPQPSGN